MSDEVQPSSEEQTQEPPNAPASEQQPVDHAAAIDNLDTNGLARALGFEPEDESEPATQPEPKAATDETAPQDQPGDQEEPDQPEEIPSSEQRPEPTSQEQPENPADQKPKEITRVSVKALPADQRAEVGQAMDLIRDGKAKDLPEAFQILRGKPESPEAPAATEKPPAAETPETPPAPTVTELETQLSQLREQRDTAEDDFDRDSVRRLTREIEDLGIKIAQTRAEEIVRQQTEQQSAQSYQRDYFAAVTEMEQRFPDSSDDASAFSKLLDDKVEAARARKDPALSDPRHILKFAEEIDTLINGSKPKRSAEQPKPKATAAPTPPTRQKPVGSGLAPTRAPAARITKDQAQHAINNASVEQLGAALFPE